jgi:low temperature requirement protein LtrA
MIGFGDIFWWPFAAAGAAIGFAIALIVFVFWLWMLIDCFQRKFKNDAEKIVWVVLIFFLTWVGAIAYYIAVRAMNPRGISK